MKSYKKFTVKIPNNVKMIYNKKESLLLILGTANNRMLKLNFKVILIAGSDLLYVTSVKTQFTNKAQEKKKKSLRKTLMALIKQNVLDSSNRTSVKLKMIGVGYKIFKVNSVENLFQLKLGFSHSLFYRPPKGVEIRTSKYTLIYVLGHSDREVTQCASRLRSYKKPEPYKGKGILYRHEKIKLKQGKKI